MRSTLPLGIALALFGAAAPAQAQQMHVVSLESRALTPRDASRIVSLLDAWRRIVAPVAVHRQDPLAAIHAAGAEVILPPGATYDPVCSATLHEAVFTMGEEPSAEEVAGLTDLAMQGAAVLARTPTEEAPRPRPRAKDPAAAMAMLDGVIQGAQDGKSAPALLSGEAGGGLFAAEMRRHQGVRAGASQRTLARLDTWYAAQGFVRESHGSTGDEDSGVLLARTPDGGGPRVDVSIAAYNEVAGWRPTCGLTPRGVRITMTADAVTPPGSDAAIEAMTIAMLGDPDGGIHDRFRDALAAEGLDYPGFVTLMRVTMDARWLASVPELRAVMVAKAREEPANGAAAAILQHDRNVAWYEAHREALEAAIARWRGVFED